MEQRNLNKLLPFIELYNNGEIIYRDGELFKYFKHKGGRKFILEEPISMRIKGNRYWRVTYERVTCYEHIVIYAVFHGVEEMKKFECIDHVDCNKKNNKIENLEGVSIDENNMRAKKNGLLYSAKGSDNKQAILNESQIVEIRELWNGGDTTYTQYEIAEMFNIKQPTVSDIVRYRKWKHVN